MRDLYQKISSAGIGFIGLPMVECVTQTIAMGGFKNHCYQGIYFCMESVLKMNVFQGRHMYILILNKK